MLLKQATLTAIREGRVTLAFRRWRRPTVKAGGTLLTSIGQLGIDAVDPVDADEISPADAEAAGFGSVASLIGALGDRDRGRIHRVRLRLIGPDPRVALREEPPDDEAFVEITKRLNRWDVASPIGPWTKVALELIASRPEVRAGDLADELGMEKPRFKTNVRKLKGLGLTESLEVGYRLSPRGRAVLERISRG